MTRPQYQKVYGAVDQKNEVVPTQPSVSHRSQIPGCRLVTNLVKSHALGFGCHHAADEMMSAPISKDVAASADPAGQLEKKVTRLKDYADVWSTETRKLEWWKLILDARPLASLLRRSQVASERRTGLFQLGQAVAIRLEAVHATL
ncbi:Hypothetical protein PHPALM_20959 [Phytophthora palmivora]|uniref:Uncharacterized protein n=1 Tax=Phytophthora palmivora TaxID=4796 RepID=A0A2P4XDI8_9STRA|nr:Hypothetical protein PHPALM_20959 [Phytophthora palmivora]